MPVNKNADDKIQIEDNQEQQEYKNQATKDRLKLQDKIGKDIKRITKRNAFR